MQPTEPNRALDVLSSGGISLSLPENLPFEEWRDIGAQLGRARSRLGWLIGDWWNYGWHRYGERKQLVEEWEGPSFQACEDYAYVAGRFETSRRREVLSFQHHREVAALVPTEADELLDWCLEGVADGNRDRKSTRELRDEVKRRADAKRMLTWRATQERRQALIDEYYETRDEPPRRAINPPVAPAITLDQSSGGGPVPTELTRLIEPRPEAESEPDHRAEIARAAFDALPPDQRLEVLKDCAAKLGFCLRPCG